MITYGCERCSKPLHRGETCSCTPAKPKTPPKTVTKPKRPIKRAKPRTKKP